MNFRCVLWVSLLLLACGCGGGGGGSSPASQPANPPAGGGGSTGGGSGGSSMVTNGGLISGGAGVSVDTGAVGVTLDVAVGGTGLVAGDIQGFGSVIANGFTVNTDSAQFLIEGVVGSQADLKQGQQVLMVGDTTTNVATQVLYRSNIKGLVTAATVQDLTLGQATFVVLGQTVISDASTTYANVDIAGVLVGSELEVSGVVEDDGRIRASYIELKTNLTEYKVTGQISGVSQNELTIGGLTVDFSNAILKDFDGAAIAAGDVVEVKAVPADFVVPDQLAAFEVEKLPTLTLGGDAVVRLEGFIDRFTSATDFDVQTAPVTTDANTVFVNGDESSLGLDVKVQVEGVGDGNGATLAQRVTIQPTSAIRAEGNIEAIDSTLETVTLLGVVFQLRDLTELEDDSSLPVNPLTLTDLGVGDELELRGYIDGTNVIATRLEREDLDDRARLRGFVSNIDSVAGTFDLQGVTISVNSGVTEFQDVNDSVITQAEFFALLDAGIIASARWDTFTATSVVADEVSLEDD
jgi:uncharacterized protein DUF5666